MPTDADIAWAAGLFEESSRVLLTGGGVSRRSLMSLEIGKFGYVHFATHGLLKAGERPTGLWLGATKEDGGESILTPQDVLTLRMSAGLVVLSPLLLLVALLIKLDSPGPVFFLQRRYGFNQNPFRILKFRTMTTLDDGPVVPQARHNDPRVTPLGRFLRKWNIDELPQLINVLKGDMSLVGPRPHALSHNREYEQKIALYARRHNVLPGITGWAQVNGFRGETDTDDKMRRRVDHDLYYIDNWSLWLDLRILAMTLFSRGV
jgi:lipopolysaccharide/colanic/teichoic acid biosynthesis glycosyltransferase